jgi:tetratricopeptide (TPR) repeat protein
MLLNDADLRAWAGHGPLNTDAFPRLEFSAPRSMARTQKEQGESNLKILRSLEAAAQDGMPRLDLPRAGALYELGRLDGMRSLYPRALRRLGEAESLGQQGPALDLALGRALFYSGRGNEASLRLARAFPKLREDYVAFLKEGGFYLKNMRPDLALGVFEMGCRAMPADADAHYGRGLSLARLGRHQEALAALRQSLQLKPELEIARKTLAELEELLKNQGQ